jgi:hypothetical protein
MAAIEKPLAPLDEPGAESVLKALPAPAEPAAPVPMPEFSVSKISVSFSTMSKHVDSS